MTTTKNPDDVSAAELRAELSPVSERFAAFETQAAVIVYDRFDADRWIMSDGAVPRTEMR